MLNNCESILSFMLDKGQEAENLQKECLFLLYISQLVVHVQSMSESLI